jgi:hypothetical protein
LALRGLLPDGAKVASAATDTLAELLHELHCLAHRPQAFEVEVALEALFTEEEVLG